MNTAVSSKSSPPVEIGVVRTGIANLASVFAGLKRVGGEPRIIETPGEVERVPLLVLPGVGAFGPAMARLRECGLVEPLIERFRAGRPMLVICLGLQLLCEESEESPGVKGLGVLPAKVTRFRGEGVCVPQLGWNRVCVRPCSAAGVARSRVFEDGYAYFANSYRVDLFTPSDPSASLLVAEHGTGRGGEFVAGIELAEGRIAACQLHPELSGAWGLAMLRRWIDVSTLPLATARRAVPPGATTC